MIKGIKKVTLNLAGLMLLAAAPAQAQLVNTNMDSGVTVPQGAFPVTSVFQANDPAGNGFPWNNGRLLGADPNFAAYAGLNWPQLGTGLLLGSQTGTGPKKPMSTGFLFETPIGALKVNGLGKAPNPDLSLIVQDENNDYWQSNKGIKAVLEIPGSGAEGSFGSGAGDSFSLDYTPNQFTFVPNSGTGTSFNTGVNKLAIVWGGYKSPVLGVNIPIYISFENVATGTNKNPGPIYIPATYCTNPDQFFNFELDSANDTTGGN